MSRRLLALSRVRLSLLAGLLTSVAAGATTAETLAQPTLNALERSAASYIEYRQDVTALETVVFKDPEITRDAHRRLAAHDPKAISAGFIAYAALVAADTPEFAEAIKTEMQKKKNRRRNELGGRDGLLSNMAQDFSFLRSLDGADMAVTNVLAMTAKDGARITSLGETFKSQAYAMQKTKWGKKRIAASQSRIQEADAYSDERGEPSMPDFEHRMDNGVMVPTLASESGAWSASWGETAPAGTMRQANAAAMMDRILSLAARYATESLNEKLVSVYSRDKKSENCLSLSKLTLNQCIAATRTPYEEAFCLGEHGLNDVATCVGWIGDIGS